MLLLIDTDRLSSAVRFERPGTGGEAFPHVYGPMDLDVIFEVTPYRPGPDGGFHPHEEATGFAAHGAATLKDTAGRALKVMAGFPQPWWVAGGWALDLFLGRKTRPHADLEFSILAADRAPARVGSAAGGAGGVAAGLGRELDPASVPSGVGASRPRTPSGS